MGHFRPLMFNVDISHLSPSCNTTVSPYPSYPSPPLLQIAVYIGFAIFLLGWIMQTVVIFGVPYTPAYYTSINSAITIIFSIFPWCTLAKGVQDLSSATISSSSPGGRSIVVAWICCVSL